MFSTNGVGTATLSLVHLRFLVELCVAAHSFVRCFMDRCSVLRLLYCGHCIVRSPIYKKSFYWRRRPEYPEKTTDLR
jgi:hypothetical protein